MREPGCGSGRERAGDTAGAGLRFPDSRTRRFCSLLGAGRRPADIALCGAALSEREPAVRRAEQRGGAWRGRAEGGAARRSRRTMNRFRASKFRHTEARLPRREVSAAGTPRRPVPGDAGASRGSSNGAGPCAAVLGTRGSGAARALRVLRVPSPGAGGIP